MARRRPDDTPFSEPTKLVDLHIYASVGLNELKTLKALTLYLFPLLLHDNDLMNITDVLTWNLCMLNVAGICSKGDNRL